MLALFLLQASATIIPEYGIPTGVAGLVLWFWRQDRSDRMREREAQEKRHHELAEDFRRIVQDNTRAITLLTDMVAARTTKCPFVERAEAWSGARST
jgi:hypothetical protein